MNALLLIALCGLVGQGLACSSNGDTASTAPAETTPPETTPGETTAPTTPTDETDEPTEETTTEETTTEETTTEATTPETTPETTPPPAGCKVIRCSLSGSQQCDDSNVRVQPNGWSPQTTSETFDNPQTGVPARPYNSNLDPQTYQGTMVEARQSTADLNFDLSNADIEPTQVRYLFYEAISGVALQTCFDGGNCQEASNRDVTVADYRNWQQRTVTVPEGTDSISFKVDQTGEQLGAVGVGQVEIIQDPNNEGCAGAAAA